jgi:hypothetical protein
MMLDVSAPDGDRPDVTSEALAGWGRTARACVIILAERSPALAWLAWLATRR